MDNLNQDSPLHLADALADEIALAPPETLLGEVSEDSGDRLALAREFDAVVAHALHRSRRRRLAKWVKNGGLWLSQSLLRKPVMVPVATLATLVVAVVGYQYHDARLAAGGIESPTMPAGSQPQPRIAPPVLASRSDDHIAGQALAPAPANGPPAQLASPSPQPQSDLQKALAAYDAARAYQARDRAAEAANRGDYAAAIASLDDARRSCDNRCQPALRRELDSDRARAEKAVNTVTVAAAPPAAAPPVNTAAGPVASQSPPLFDWPAKGRVTVSFGAPAAVARSAAPAKRAEGMTIAVPATADIRAAADGVVSSVGADNESGKALVIRHDDDLKTGYAHLRKVLVRRSDQVHRGQVVAKGVVSSPGAPPQLYFEIRKGAVPVDPMRYLPAVK